MRDRVHFCGWHLRAFAVVIVAAGATAISSSVALASPSTLAVRQSVAPARLALPIPSPLDPTLIDLPLDIPTGCVVRGGLGRHCTSGNVGARRRFVVFGDSHAAAWMPGMNHFGTHHRWSITPIIHTGCTLGVATDGGSVCGAWWRKVAPRIKQLRPAFMIVAQYYDPRHPAAQMYAGLRTELRTFRKLVPTVIVMEDDPRHPDINPVDCLADSGATLGSCTLDYPAELDTEHRTIQRMVNRFGAHYMRTKRWFCFGGKCPTVVGTTVVYRDTEHMTITYSRQIAADVSHALAQLLPKLR